MQYQLTPKILGAFTQQAENKTLNQILRTENNFKLILSCLNGNLRYYQIGYKNDRKLFHLFTNSNNSIPPKDIGISSSYWNLQEILAKSKENRTDLLAFCRGENRQT
jgi:hypothetical protein